MQIPVYTATKFIEVLTKGGSTKPWLIETLVEEHPSSFVVKVFKTKTLQQYPAVSNEVFANLLAREFDLHVPDMALIRFDKSFIQSLPAEQKQLIQDNTIDYRLKFATLYIENSTIYKPTIHKEFLETYEMENIYGFDNLIYNIDRRKIKPNMLIAKDTFYLIDHELSLSNRVSNELLGTIQKGNWPYSGKDHLFYDDLKENLQVESERTFDTLHEHLRNLDQNCLDEAAISLEKAKHQSWQVGIFKRYLRYLKREATVFIKHIQNQLLA